MIRGSLCRDFVRGVRGVTSGVSGSGESLAVIAGTPREHASRKLIIYRPGRMATQQGRGGKTKTWLAKFEKFEGKDRWINPLMGWTSTGDPLSNAALQFTTREAAVEFAQRNGYRFVVEEPEDERENLRNFGAYGKSMVHQWRHSGIPVYAGDEEK
mmetsp:Transcript_10208/g.20595  ORF Transcript_10208/g.20595 Transcript_10208/m.20595 type:complete len:156 (-) Transcript_10208:3019-3486(-)